MHVSPYPHVCSFVCLPLHSERYQHLEHSRNNRVVALAFSDFQFGTQVGKPLAVTISKSYHVEVKPAALHFAPGGAIDSLWIAEYAEPRLLNPNGQEAANQGQQEFGSGPASTQADPLPPGPSSTKQPDSVRPKNQKNRPRVSVSAPEVPPEMSAVRDLKVRALHCNPEFMQCGWAIRQDLHPTSGLLDPASVGDSLLDGPGVVWPDAAIFVGEGVRGFALASQLGRDYAVVHRCTFASGYACRVEFHRIDDRTLENGGAEMVVSIYTGRFFEARLLDPGTPPDSEEEASGGSSDTPKKPDKDRKSQDKASRKGDRRKSRAKQKKSKKKRKKGTRNSVARKKKKKGKKPDTEVEERNLGDQGTMASVFAVPSGATGMAYRITTSENFLMFLFASGSQPYFDQVLVSGQDVEDSVHLMWLPGLATLPPDVQQNVVYVKYLMQYKITPRCVLPIGSECKEDSKAGKAESKPGGKKKPKKKPRRLQENDSPTGGDMSPMSSMATAVHEHAYARAGEQVPWGDATPSRHHVVAHTARQLETRGEKYADLSRCISADFNLIPETEKILYEYKYLFFIGPAPVTIEIVAAIVWWMDFALTACIIDKTIIGTLIPQVALEVEVFGGIEVPYLARAGIEILVRLMHIQLLPSASLTIKNGMGVCLAFDIVLRPISINVRGVLSLFLCIKFCEACVSVFGAEICVSLPCGLKFCPDKTFPIWKWSLAPIKKNLFVICNTPPDSTPPEKADAVVTGTQIDPETFLVSWGGFYDEESNIKSYTACLGTTPGGQDVVACVNTERDQSAMFRMVDVSKLDGKKIYANVLAKNGEGLETLVSDRITVDNSAPVIGTINLLRQWDRRYTVDPLMKHGDPQSVQVSVRISESNPEKHIRIATVEAAVGLGPSSFQDAAEWTEVLTDFNESPSSQFSLSGLILQHAVEYYLHIRTTNSIGLQSIATAPTRIFVDLTPAKPVNVWVQNGQSIMLEYLLEWMPFEAGNPEFSATAWLVSPVWNFDDPESELLDYDVSLVEAKGDPLKPIASAHVTHPETSVTLDGFSLPHLFQYEIRVRAHTDADLYSVGVSPTVTIDITRPHIRQVLDLKVTPTEGPLAIVPTPGSDNARGLFPPGLLTPAQKNAIEMDFVVELTELHIGFAAWDEDSGIKFVMVAVGPAPGSTGVMDWTPIVVDGVRHITVPLPPSTTLLRHLRYYVAVAAVNGAGLLSLWASSDGIMKDDTPPVCVEYRVRDGTHRLLDSDFTGISTEITAQWKSALFDLESLVERFEVSLLDADSDLILAGPVQVAKLTKFTFKDLTLAHTQRVRSVVRAINRAGAYLDCSTNGILVDLTGPVPTPHDAGVVWDGNSALFGYEDADLEYTWATRSAFAAWTQFIDPESGINNYWLWTEAMDGSVLSDRVWVHPSLKEWTMPIPTMSHGDQYRVVVRAVNRAGSYKDYRSDGTEVDVTPPVFSSPVEFRIDGPVGLEPHIIASESAKLSIIVNASDPESGVLRCRYALGTYPDGSDLTGVITREAADVDAASKTVVQRTRGGEEICLFDGTCIDIPASTHSVVTNIAIDEVLNKDVALLNHFTFYAWIVCINNADEFIRQRAPRALIVDARPPSAGLVFDGLPMRPEIDLSPSNETFAANWRWWKDHETGIRYFEAGLGTRKGAVDVQDWVNVGLKTQVFMSFFEERQLIHGTRYFVTVRATDNAGHQTIASSDGVTIDITPPLDGDIEHGLWDTPVRKYTNRHDLVLMRWVDMRDPQSGIVAYEFGLSSTPTGDEEGKPDMVPLVYIGLSDQAAVINVEMEHAHVYYGAVRSKNGVGMRRLTYSRGVLVDLTPPECSIWDGSFGLPDMNFSTEGVPRVAVHCTDLESGAARVRWGLGTVQGWDDAMPMQDGSFAALEVPPHLDRIHNKTIGEYHTSPWRIMFSDLASYATKLLDGVRYYGVVYVENGAGSWVWRVTNGQVHDSSPPRVVFGPRDVVGVEQVADMAFTANQTHWGVRFRVSDPHTGVANLSVQLLTTDADQGDEEVLLDEVVLGTADVVHHIVRAVPSASSPLVPGVLVWTRILSSNNVGLHSATDSDGWKVDITAPFFDAHPTDGPNADVDALYQSTAGSLAACWRASDDESQVDHFLISARLAHEPFTQLTGWSPVPASSSANQGVYAGYAFVTGVTCAWASGFEVEQGQAYQVMVRAVNPLGHVRESNTSGVLVDWTPPSIGRVFIGDAAEVEEDTAWQTHSTSIAMAWTNITEPDTPLVAVEVGLGTRPGWDDVVPRETVTAAPDTGARNGSTHVFSGLALRDGAQYFVTLWATNVVGLVTQRSSPGLRIDTSPPAFVELPHMPFEPRYSFPLGFNDQPTYPGAVHGGSVIVPVTPFLDPHSGIVEVSAAAYQSVEDPILAADLNEGDLVPIGFTQVEGLAEIKAATAVDVSNGLLSAVLDGVVLTNNTFVWVEVNVTNGVGFRISTASRPVLISTETLSPGYVNDGHAGDGPTDDVNYQPSTTAYSARWAGFTDPKSDIWYSVGLGSLPGLADLRDWEYKGHETFLDVLQDFSVPRGTVVYATVKAWNDIGVRVNASSDGIVLGSWPPVVSDVRFGAPSPLSSTPADPTSGAYYVAPSPVVVAWNVSDLQGLGTCTVQVADSARGGEVLLEAETAPGVEVVEWDVAMPEGQVMYAKVECVNIRGQRTSLRSERWAVVETTPPRAGQVVDGAAVAGDVDMAVSRVSDVASAHWMHFGDEESHIVSFSACLGTPLEPCSEAGPIHTGADAHVEATGLHMEDGVTYVWTVNATSGAGITTAARSDGFVVDTTAPNATGAVVQHGLQTELETTVDANLVEISWDGFVDATSGIDHYVVSLGWAPGAADVAARVRVPAEARSHVFGALDDVVSPGGRVYATVAAVDVVGYNTTLHTEGIFVDETAPVAPSGPHHIIETSFNSTKLAGVAGAGANEGGDVDIMGGTALRVAWLEFVDPESGTFLLAVCSGCVSLPHLI